MKVQATSFTHTTVTGEISERELISILTSAGLHIPASAGVRFWVENSHANADVDGEEPLRFSVSWRSDPVTTPPASAGDASPT